MWRVLSLTKNGDWRVAYQSDDRAAAEHQYRLCVEMLDGACMLVQVHLSVKYT